MQSPLSGHLCVCVWWGITWNLHFLLTWLCVGACVCACACVWVCVCVWVKVGQRMTSSIFHCHCFRDSRNRCPTGTQTHICRHRHCHTPSHTHKNCRHTDLSWPRSISIKITLTHLHEHWADPSQFHIRLTHSHVNLKKCCSHTIALIHQWLARNDPCILEFGKFNCIKMCQKIKTV